MKLFEEPMLKDMADAKQSGSDANISEWNCSDPNAPIPKTKDLFRDIPPERMKVVIPILSILALMVLIMFLIFIGHVRHIWTNTSCKARRLRLVILTGTYPMFGVAALTGMVVPRAELLVDFVAATYLSFALFQLFFLVVGYFGGEHRLQETLSKEPVRVNRMPLACCCPCLPRIHFTWRKYMIFKTGILQIVLTRPVVMFISAVLLINGSFFTSWDPHDWFIWYFILNILSIVTCMYCFAVIGRPAKDYIQEKYKILPKYISLQACLILSGLQPLLISIIGSSTNVVPCYPPLATKERTQSFYHLVLIVEMFFISLITIRAWRFPTVDTEHDLLLSVEDECARACRNNYTPNTWNDSKKAVNKKAMFYGSV